MCLERTPEKKLGLRNGLSVNIESPLLPRELLSYEEHPHYHGYAFFNELLTAPRN